MHYSQDDYRRAWEAFTATGKQDILPDDEIILSWKRSREYGLNPDGGSPAKRALSPRALERLLRDNAELLEIGRKHIDSAYGTIRDTDVFISLANADGIILYVVGDSGMSSSASRNNVVIGSSRIERVAGTNAVGLAILLKRYVQTHGCQHYNRNFHRWACSAAPVLGSDGQVAGTVNIVCGMESVHQHTLSLTRSLADIISTDRRLREKNDQLLKSNRYLDQVMQKADIGILILDDKLHLVSCNDYAVSVMGEGLRSYAGRHVSDCFLAPLPDFFNSRVRVRQDVMLKTRMRSLWCDVEFSPIADGGGGPAGYVLFFFEANRRNMDAHKIVGPRVHYHFSDLIGGEPKFKAAVHLARVAASSNTRVLVQGESGTGKELVAQSIHNESAQRNGPFVPINCAAVPHELIESELFGYAPGAFTGAAKSGRPGKLETANHGTIFFDEIGDMPWDMQSKLLRVLQDNYVTRVGSSEEIFLDVRYIFATNVDLEEKVAAGLFRQDLYYRISVFTLRLPSLRERRGDIPLLVDSLAGKIARRLNFPLCGFDADVLDALNSYAWPGNIRQLENMLERLVLLSQGGVVRRDMLPESLLAAAAPEPEAPWLEEGRLAGAERRTIEEVLVRNKGNITASAKMLGIARKTLYAKIREFSIKHP